MVPSTENASRDFDESGAELEVFFDGECPLCAREVSAVRKMDGEGKIHFTDIAMHKDDSLGLPYEQLMSEIYARTREGEIVKGVETFRRMYGLLGFRVPVALSRAWGVRQFLDVTYKVWAKNRLRLTGRCEDGVCAVEG